MDFLNIANSFGLLVSLIIGLGFITAGLLTIFVLIKYGKNRTTVAVVSLTFISLLVVLLVTSVLRFYYSLS